MSILKDQKVIFISLTNGAGGAEQILLMSARVTNSTVIFLKKVTSVAIPLDHKIDQARFLNSRSILLGFILLIKELIPYRKNYVIISSHPYLNAYLGILKRIGFLKSKLVTRECTSVFLRFSGLKRLSYKLVYMLGYPVIDLLICQTEEMKAQLLNNLTFLKSDRVKVLKNPLDLNYVIEKANTEIDDPLIKQDYICSAGRLIELKGFNSLISAFAEISKDHPHYKLIILGEGVERSNLESQIKNMGLTGKVILKGFVGNPFPYFKNARVCVVSSIREGFPNVLLQMMAVNNAVVSTLCAEGIEEFDTVRKVRVSDIEGLRQAMEDEMTSIGKENLNLQFIADRKPDVFMRSILDNI